MNLAKQVTTSIFCFGMLCCGMMTIVNNREVTLEQKKEHDWKLAQQQALERERIAKEVEAKEKAEEEARKKAEEEAEAKKKAEAEAKRKAEEEAKKKAEEEAQAQAQAQAQAYTEPQPAYGGDVLTKGKGTIIGPSGKETYYNLPMEGVVSIMRGMGNNDEYWVREDGVKMLGDYVIIAANLGIRPRGSLVQTSLGMGIVCDTGGFASANPTQIDIATAW